MTPLEAAREINDVDAELVSVEAWKAFPQIVAALEAAEVVMSSAAHRSACDMYHVDKDDMQTLRRALEGGYDLVGDFTNEKPLNLMIERVALRGEPPT